MARTLNLHAHLRTHAYLLVMELAEKVAAMSESVLAPFHH
jgi:hypothetical protein